MRLYFLCLIASCSFVQVYAQDTLVFKVRRKTPLNAAEVIENHVVKEEKERLSLPKMRTGANFSAFKFSPALESFEDLPAHIQAVQLDFLVDSSGYVQDIRVLACSNPHFAKRVSYELQKTYWEPARNPKGEAKSWRFPKILVYTQNQEHDAYENAND